VFEFCILNSFFLSLFVFYPTQEAKVCNHGKSPHSRWRNYDDINEYFWAPFCFELGWPWRLEAGFFVKPKQDTTKKRFKLVS
jgi:callose synthase